MWRMQLFVFLCLLGVSFGQDYNLVWSDDFNGGIDPAKWTYGCTAWGGGNNEFQVYIPDEKNGFTQGGNLHIKPTLLAESTNPLTGQPFGEDFLVNGELDLDAMYGYCDVYDLPDEYPCHRLGGDIPPVASARLHSVHKFSFRYGRIEIRAKLPVGDWLWPALWLMPQSEVYGGWPRSGEIDLVESIGNRDYNCGGTRRDITHMSQTMHWGPVWNDNKWFLTQSHANNEVQNYGDYFHTYRLDWSPQGMQFYCDDELVMNVPDPLIHERNPSNCWTGFWDFGQPWIDPNNPWTPDRTYDEFMAPFDQEFFIILLVAVGGTNGFIPDNCQNSGPQKPWANGVGQVAGMWQFYDRRDDWYPMWQNEGDNLHLQVDYVRVYQRDGDDQGTQVPDGCPQPGK